MRKTEMGGDTLGKRIRELRLERQSAEWVIEDLRAKSKEPPDDLCTQLREVSEALFIALDDQAEKI